MLFYIGTGWDNRAMAREVAARLQAAGWKWVYDWTQHQEGEERHAAIKEIEAIKRADLVIILLPGGRGTHVELGAALAAGKPVVLWAEDIDVLYQDGRYCGFYDHPHVLNYVGWPLDLMIAHWTRRAADDAQTAG